MSATTTAACGSASAIRASRSWCTRYVLSDFAKSERDWVEALSRHHRRQCRAAGARPGRELPEQGASRHGRQGLRARGDRRRLTRRQAREHHGFQMRHRRPAQCRQVDALQCADRRRRRRRRRTIRSAPSSRMSARWRCRIRGSTTLAKLAKSERDRADAADVRRHRRAGAAAPRRARGSATSSSPTSARSTPSRMWCAASRTIDVTHVEGRIDPVADIETIETELMLADLDSLEKRVDALEKKAKGSGEEAKEAKEALDLIKRVARAAARRQAGALRRAQARGGEAVSPARPADLAAGALRLQRRRRLGRDRQRVCRARSRRAPRKRARAAWSISAKIEAEIAALPARGARELPRRPRAEGARPRPADPRRLRAAASRHLLHRRPEGGARLDHHQGHQGRRRRRA